MQAILIIVECVANTYIIIQGIDIKNAMGRICITRVLSFKLHHISLIFFLHCIRIHILRVMKCKCHVCIYINLIGDPRFYFIFQIHWRIAYNNVLKWNSIYYNKKLINLPIFTSPSYRKVCFMSRNALFTNIGTNTMVVIVNMNQTVILS